MEDAICGFGKIPLVGLSDDNLGIESC